MLLCVQVHRQNKELSNNCSNAEPGQPRTEQRNTARVRLASERAAEKAEQQAIDPEYKLLKKIKLNCGQLSVLKNQSDIVSMQLRMFAENKESYVKIHGEDEYDEKITTLLGKLPDPVVSLMGDEADGAEVDSDIPGDDGTRSDSE